MPVVVQRLVPFWFRVEDTAEARQLLFIEGRRHPCRAAEAHPHGLVDHRDSLVAVLGQGDR